MNKKLLFVNPKTNEAFVRSMEFDCEQYSPGIPNYETLKVSEKDISIYNQFKSNDWIPVCILSGFNNSQISFGCKLVDSRTVLKNLKK